jgi:transketolase
MSNQNEGKTISTRAADNIRILAAGMVEKAKSGHPGGPMGGADFVQVLYSEFLNYDPDDMSWPMRDRFFLDAGHMSPMLYGVHTLLGNYSMDDIKSFRQWGSPTPGHPEVDVSRGIENTSGPLGLGHAFGAGAAIAERFLAARFGEVVEHMTYLYISDGGIQEEISQGVGRIAGYLGLGKLVMFYDANDVQLSTMVGEVTQEDTAKKYEAWNWHVVTIDGNDTDAIRHAIQSGIDESERPTLIIGKTVMGKGAMTESGEIYEGKVDTHGQPLSKSGGDFAASISNLGGDPEDAFQLFPEVKEFYTTVLDRKREQAKKRKAAFEIWKMDNPKRAIRLEKFFSTKIQDIDWSAIEQKQNAATRVGSSAVLSHLADHVENMIVSSADLSNSDKTDGFLKKTTAFQKGDFKGQFLQAGVAELTMSALCTGLALHGGVIPVCATFFAFSDYMKPAMRVAALMETPVIFIWTHDAFRVGEDGPTHQPIEQEAQLRLLEQLKNHSGENSLLALRPADTDEATVAWKMAFENRKTPTGMIFSRQNIKTLPASEGNTRYKDALNAQKGAYIVQDCEGTPDVILVANGSEVATLIEGAAKLTREEGKKVRVVSAISEGLFRNQNADYQESVLPSNCPTFGLTAGLPSTLQGLVGASGKVFGMTHFGYSAPYTVLDEKFGFTGEIVVKQVLEMINPVS